MNAKKSSSPKKSAKAARKAPATKPASIPPECELEVGRADRRYHNIPSVGSTVKPLVLNGRFDEAPYLITEVTIFRLEGSSFIEEEPDRFGVVAESVRVAQFNQLSMELYIDQTAYDGPKFFTVWQHAEGDKVGCRVDTADPKFDLVLPRP